MQAVSNNRPIQHSGRTQEQKDAEKKVVTGGGAIAATTAAAKLKSTKAGIDTFVNGTRGATDTIRTTQQIASKTGKLWAKVVESAKWAKDAVLNWGSKFKNLKYVKPLIESKLFRGCAGALGYAFGAVTLVAGLADIGKVATDTIESKTGA